MFCGAIAVVVLEADTQLFSTIMTDASLHDLAQEYSLVLTRRQHRRLQSELSVVFWNLLFWLTVGYVGTVQLALRQTENPEPPYIILQAVSSTCIAFVFTTDLMVELYCTCREVSEGITFTARELALRFFVAAVRKPLGLVVMAVVWQVCTFLFYYRNSELQALKGDIRYEVTGLWTIYLLS